MKPMGWRKKAIVRTFTLSNAWEVVEAHRYKSRSNWHSMAIAYDEPRRKKILLDGNLHGLAFFTMRDRWGDEKSAGD